MMRCVFTDENVRPLVACPCFLRHSPGVPSPIPAPSNPVRCAHHSPLVACALQLKTESLLVHRAALCLWFAVVCHVVAQWADVINQSRSRASRMLWLAYFLAITIYAVIVFAVTLVALVWATGHTKTVLLDVPDIARGVGEMISLCGFVTTGYRILARYFKLPSHFRGVLRHAVRSLAAVLTVCGVLFLLRWTFTVVATVRTFTSHDPDALTSQVLIYECGIGRLSCQIVAEWIPEIVSSLAIILLQWRERKQASDTEDASSNASGPVRSGSRLGYGAVDSSVDGHSRQGSVGQPAHSSNEMHVAALQQALHDAAMIADPMYRAEHEATRTPARATLSALMDSMARLERMASIIPPAPAAAREDTSRPAVARTTSRSNITRSPARTRVEPRVFPYRIPPNAVVDRVVHDPAPSVLQLCVAVRVDGVTMMEGLSSCFATVECFDVAADGTRVKTVVVPTIFRSEAIVLSECSEEVAGSLKSGSQFSTSDIAGSPPSSPYIKLQRLGQGMFVMLFRVELPVEYLNQTHSGAASSGGIPVSSGSVNIPLPAGVGRPVASAGSSRAPPASLSPTDPFIVNHFMKFNIYFAPDMNSAEAVPNSQLGKIRHMVGSVVTDVNEVTSSQLQSDGLAIGETQVSFPKSAAMHYGAAQCTVADLLDGDEGEIRLPVRRGHKEMAGRLTIGVVALKRGNAERIVKVPDVSAAPSSSRSETLSGHSGDGRATGPVLASPQRAPSGLSTSNGAVGGSGSGSFAPALSPSTAQGDAAGYGCRVTRWYLLPSLHGTQLLVEEDLRESSYVFDVPAKMLKLLIMEKQHKLTQLKALYRQFTRSMRSWSTGRTYRPRPAGHLAESDDLKESLLSSQCVSRDDTVAFHGAR